MKEFWSEENVLCRNTIFSSIAPIIKITINFVMGSETMYFSTHESESSAKMEADKDTVGRDDLQKRLVTSGFFNQDEALTIIDVMVGINRIKEVKWDTYRRDNSNSNSNSKGHTS